MFMRKLFTGAILAMILAAVAQAAVPQQFAVQGVLRNSAGMLQSMTINVEADFYDAQMGGNLVAGPFLGSALAVNGLFTVTFTDAKVSDILKTQSGALWVQLKIGNDTYPAQQVTPGIWALECGTADVSVVANSLAATAAVPGSQITAGSIPKSAIAPGALTHSHTVSVSQSGEGFDQINFGPKAGNVQTVCSQACPAGTIAVSGSCTIAGGPNNECGTGATGIQGAITGSYANSTFTAWCCSAFTSYTGQACNLNVWANCITATTTNAL